MIITFICSLRKYFTASVGLELHYLQYKKISGVLKFPYNTHSDWLKQHALSENRERVDDGYKVGFQIFASDF